MGRCCIQIVCGPAGSGKSTYCQAMQEHGLTVGRPNIHIANMDPAADDQSFGYEPAFDIRELISVDEVMDELELGPNGALMYAMNYLMAESENMQWFEEQLEQFGDDDILILDCPGQLELYTHVPVMRSLIGQLQLWGYTKIVAVFVIDATFVTETAKFLSGVLLSLSAMISLELPHINVLSKCDLVDKEKVEQMLDIGSAEYLYTTTQDIEEKNLTSSLYDLSVETTVIKEEAVLEARRKRNRLTEKICSVIDDYTMVSFLPLDITDEESMGLIMNHVDHAVQYGEDAEVKAADIDEYDDGSNYYDNQE